MRLSTARSLGRDALGHRQPRSPARQFIKAAGARSHWDGPVSLLQFWRRIKNQLHACHLKGLRLSGREQFRVRDIHREVTFSWLTAGESGRLPDSPFDLSPICWPLEITLGTPPRAKNLQVLSANIPTA